MSRLNYDKLLESWEPQLNSNLTKADFGLSRYCNVAARQAFLDKIIANGGTADDFTDGGLSRVCAGVTIDAPVDKTEFKPGEEIVVTGKALPNSQVRITIPGLVDGELVDVNDQGVYELSLGKELPVGEYQITAVNIDGRDVSDPTHAHFAVVTQPAIAAPEVPGTGVGASLSTSLVVVSILLMGVGLVINRQFN